MVVRVPIAVAYKKKYGTKVYVKEFLDQRTPDKIIAVGSKLLPKYVEIVDIGVGTKFYQKYKKKYK